MNYSTRLRLPLCALIGGAAALASGCAAMEGTALYGDDDDALARGQTIVFVGTDPTTLETDLYAVQAVGELDSDDLQGPDLIDAQGFDVTALVDLGVGAPTSPLRDSSDSLFTADQPFTVPDRAGTQLAVLASIRDADSGEVSAGRVALIDLAFGAEPAVSDPIDGLQTVSFTWDGGWLVYERSVPGSTGRTEVLVQRPIGVGFSDPIQIGPSADATSVEVVGLGKQSERILLLERDLETGVADVWLADPETGDAELLTGEDYLEDRVDQPALSPDGRWLAMVRSRPDSARAVVVLDLEEDSLEELTDDLVADCFWPTWAPSEELEAPRLVFVCSDLSSEQPDLLRWDAEPGAETVSLTSGPQPFIGGTMDGLVIRTEPRWDPQVQLVVFGASTPEEALSGAGMTLMVLPVEPLEGDSLVYPIWSGDEASAGWAHFSASAQSSLEADASGPMLLWDRDNSGLQDTAGNHPIHVLPTHLANPDPQPVDLGVNLLVSYPLFLGSNTMLYP